MAWYETAEDDGSWDTRTNTLTFHTFRPTSPDDLAAVSGVTPQMFNGTLERRREPRQSSIDLNSNGPAINQHHYNNHHPNFLPNSGRHCQLENTVAVYRSVRPQYANPKPIHEQQQNHNHVAYVQPYFYNSQKHPAIVKSGDPFPAVTNGGYHRPSEFKAPQLPVKAANGTVTNGDSVERIPSRSKPEMVSFRCPPKVLRNYQELLVDVILLPTESLAGFSMTSSMSKDIEKGSKAPILVYRIMKGSAAERSGLEINDEILEINGESVVNCTHDEVIGLIQKCIKSKTIQLKVRRKLNDDILPSSGASRNNSTSVGSESDTSSSNSKIQGVRDEPRTDGDGISTDHRRSEGYSLLENAPELHHRSNKERISDAYVVVSNPNEKAALISEISQRFPNARTVDMMETFIPNGGDHSSNVKLHKPQPQNGQAQTQRHNHHHHHHNNHVQTQNNGNGAYVAVPNGAPIVTPVAQHEEQETSFIVGDGDTVVVKNIPGLCGQPTIVSVGQYYGGSKTNLIRGGEQEAEADERLKRYENDLQKRREVEEQKAREDEFLRSSIRGSKKLQALAKNGRPTNGHANDAYVEFKDEQDHSDDDEDENGNPPPPVNGLSSVMPNALALDDVLMSVNRLTGALDRSPEYRDQSQFLRDLFNDQSIRNAIEVTAIAQQQWGARGISDLKPLSSEVMELVDSLMHQLDQSNSAMASEFRAIVETPVFQALLYTHDKTAEKLCENEAGPSRNGFSDRYLGCGLKETQFDHGSAGDLRVVKLIKTGDNPLGATVVQEGKTVLIGRVIKGGVAEKSGLLREGDELLEVNGVDLRSKSVHEVCSILANMQGELTFVIAPNLNADTSTDEPMPVVKHMRALFDYDPEDDNYLPCRELGLSFRKGDILHVISMADSNWWQAHRDGEENCQLAGLIPSSSFQTQKERYKLESIGNGRRSVKARRKIGDGDSEQSTGGFWCAKRRSKPKQKSNTIIFGNGTTRQRWSTSADRETGRDKNHEDDEVDSEILTYEEVTLYLSKAGTRRPVVLVGPTHVGCLQLRQKLMEMEKEKFAGAVPHTSRPRKPDEQDGVHYHFVTRQQFQEGVAMRKFVEWGEYQKHFYGTSFDAIRRVIERGKTCVLTLKPQNLKALRNSDVMPFVVFISPASFERLKVNKIRELGSNLKEDDLKNIINEAKLMEIEFGHYFDKVIVNYDLDRSFQELRTDIHRLETEPQWVNAEWIRRQRQTGNGSSFANQIGYTDR